jgi:2-dehydro-3-deoxyglucarate aldolase
VIDALSRYEKTCKKKNFAMGYHVIEPESDQLLEKINAGYNFIAFSTDFLFMGKKAKMEMNDLKIRLEE